jgi:restriction system protein
VDTALPDARGVGRTSTARDDCLSRVIGPLPLHATLVISATIYAGVGLALPLLIQASTPLLVCCNISGAALSWTVLLAWLFPLTQARRREDLLDRTSDLRLLAAAEFEVLVGELLRREGWTVRETGGHGHPDGNIDLRIHRADQTMLVLCKRWDSRPVRVDEVRKLAGTLMREGLPGAAGMLVTSSDFTPAARAEAAAVGLELVGRQDLLRRLKEAGAVQLLAAVRDVERTHRCPNCAEPMVLDHSPYGWSAPLTPPAAGANEISEPTDAKRSRSSSPLRSPPSGDDRRYRRLALACRRSPEVLRMETSRHVAERPYHLCDCGSGRPYPVTEMGCRTYGNSMGLAGR